MTRVGNALVTTSTSAGQRGPVATLYNATRSVAVLSCQGEFVVAGRVKYDGTALLPLPVLPGCPSVDLQMRKCCSEGQCEPVEGEKGLACPGAVLCPLSLHASDCFLFHGLIKITNVRKCMHVCLCPSASMCQQCPFLRPEEGHFDHSLLPLTLRLTVLATRSELAFISHCPARGQWQMSRQMCAQVGSRLLRVSRFDRPNRSIYR